MKYRLCALLLLGICHGAIAEGGCSVPVTELQAGVNEVDLGNVKVKLEQFNKLAKMKLISSLNEDWTSVSTESDVAEISGYYGNGSNAKLVAQLYIKQLEEGYEWAIVKFDGRNKADAYFYMDGKVVCAPTTPEAWKSAVTKTIGEPAVSSVVNVDNDSL